MHPFEKNARKEFEAQAARAADAIGCDIAHVINMAANQMRALADGVSNGRADKADDLRAARATNSD